MIKFYEVDKDYIKYLKIIDCKIPNVDYEKHEKFMCGVVLNVKGMSYYAPISSFDKQQKTNILIKDNNDKIVGSIRLSFMFPVPEKFLQIKDFSKEESKYKRLLQEELDFCNKNKKKIYEKAEHIYNMVVIKEKDEYINICCKFKLLEKKSLEFKK